MSVNAAELIVLTKAVGALDAQLALEAVGAAVVAAGVESVKMAGDFQASMVRLVTSAGESQSNLKMVSDGILAMSVQVGTSTKQLADGMYMVESAGFHGAAGLEVLRLSAEGAKAENADLATVTNAVTSALNAYHLGADKAAFVTNTMVAAVGAGKMHMQDLASAVSNILPVSAKFGISLTDVTAGLATMTSMGDDASSAATHLRQMILALEAPAKAGSKALASIGLTTQEVTDQMRTSLPDAIQMITDALGRKFPEGSYAYNQAIKNIAGGSKQLMGMLELSGKSLGTFKNDVTQITNAVNAGGNSIMGWTEIQGTFNFKIDQMRSAVDVLMISLGTALLPVLSSILDKVTPLISNFSDWLTKTNALSTAAKGLSDFVGAIGAAFDFVFAPLQKVQTAMKPLTDSFDRATGFIKPLPGLLKPLTDTFDHATSVIKPVTAALNPMADSLDRATGLIKASTGAVAFTPNVWIPFWAAIKKVADQISLVDWGSIGAGIAKATVAISQLDWGAVGNAIVNVVGFIQQMVATGISVVNFFKQNELASAALGVALGTLGGVMALFAASSVADMILSLLEYGASLLATVAETVTGAAVMTSTFTEMAALIVGSMATSSTAILSTLGPFLLVGAVVAAVGIGIVLAIQHWGEISQWFSGVWAGVVSGFNSALSGMNSALQASLQWWDTWKQPIIGVAEVITFFFLPAIIQAGVQSVISGGAIVSGFVASMATTGTAAVINAALVTDKFIWGLIATGVEATANAEILVATYIASLWATGSAAVINAAKVTYSFVASLIASGVAAWEAAAKFVPYLVALLATGVDAGIAAVPLAGQFVGGIIASGIEAITSAASMTSTLIPALYATGVAAWAAGGPFIALAGAILGIGAALKIALDEGTQHAKDLNKNVTFNVDDMSTKNITTLDNMRMHVGASAEEMQKKVSDSAEKMRIDAATSVDRMSHSVSDDILSTAHAVEADSSTMSVHASAIWDKFKKNAIGSMSELDSSTISYMNDIANYIDSQSANAARVANENFAKIHMPNMSGSNVMRNLNDSSNTPGHATGITNNPVGHMAWVGERGPEIMYIPKNASIIPNNQLNSMGTNIGSSSSSGSKQPVIINLNVNGQLFARQLLPDLAHAIQYGTGITL